MSGFGVVSRRVPLKEFDTVIIRNLRVMSGFEIDAPTGFVVNGVLRSANNLSDLASPSIARATLGVAIGADVQAHALALDSISGLTTSADKMLYTTSADTYATTALTAFGRSLLDDSDSTTARTTLGVVIGTNVQAHDVALDSISGLTTSADKMLYTTSADTYSTTALTAYGRTLLDDSDSTTARATLGVVIGTDVQAHDVALDSISGLTTSSDKMLYTTSADTYATTTLTAYGRTLLDDSDSTTARATLGLVIGTDVQAHDVALDSISGLTTSADKMLYTTASDTYATTTLTAYGRTLLDDSDSTTARATLGVVIGTDVQAHDVALDSISGLTTSADKMLYTTASDTYATTTLTAYGRSLLDDSDSSTARATLGVVIGTDVQAHDVALDSISGLTTSADKMLYTTSADTYATTTLTAYGRSLLDDSDSTTARATLGVVIGTNVQAHALALDSISGLTTSADKMLYTTSADTYATTTLTAFGRSLLDDSDSTTARATLGVVIGTDVQAHDVALDSISGLATSADKMLYTTASDTYATTTLTAYGRSLLDDADSTTARTTLELGSISTQAASSVTISGGSINGTTIGNTVAAASTFSSVTLSGGNIDLGGNLVRNASEPVESSDLATKYYVDALANGLTLKTPVDASTTTNLSGVYVNGTAGVGATLTASINEALVVDGVAVSTTERVLVKNQTTGIQNGIYVVTNAGSLVAKWILTRSSDADNSPTNELRGGTYVFVDGGSTQIGNAYVITSPSGAVVIGTDPITWTRFSTNVYTADETTLTLQAGVMSIKSTYTGQTSITTLGTISAGTWSADTIALDKGGTGGTTASQARSNLGLGSAAVQNATYFLQVANNLSDLNSASTARTNLGLGSIAQLSSTNPSLAGVTVTTNPLIINLGTSSHTKFQTSAGGLRWAMELTGTESGLNAGSTLRFISFDDSGTALANSLALLRTTGAIGIGTPTPSGLFEVNTAGSGVSNQMYLSSGIGGAGSTGNKNQIIMRSTGGGGGTVTHYVEQKYDGADYGVYVTDGTTNLAKFSTAKVEFAVPTSITAAVTLTNPLAIESGGTGANSLPSGYVSSNGASLTTNATIPSDDIANTDFLDITNNLSDVASASSARTNLGVAIGTNVQAYSAALASVAGLTTSADKMIYTTASNTYAVTAFTAFGRSLVDDADASTARTTLGVVIGTNVQAYSAALASVAGLTTSADKMIYTTALDTYAITALTAFGRSLIDDADASTARTTLGVAIGTNVQAYSAALVSVAGLTTSADKMIYTTALDTYAITALTAFGRSLIDDADASTARTTLGVAIGTNVQAYSAALASVAGLTTSADKMIYTTASDTYAVTALSSFGRTLVDDADASTARTTLGLAIGTNVQAYSAALASVAGLTTSADKMIYTTASDTYAVTTLSSFGRTLVDDADASTARTTLGLGTGDSPTFTATTLTSNLTTSSGTAVHDYFKTTGGSSRWAISMTGTESGSNVGSALIFHSFDDTGSALANSIALRRTTGALGIGTTTPSGLFEVYKTGTGVTNQIYLSSGLDGVGSTSNKNQIVFQSQGGGGGTVIHYVEQKFSGSDYGLYVNDGVTDFMKVSATHVQTAVPAVINTGTSVSGTSHLIHKTSDTNRWGWNLKTAESGLNVGSDLVLVAYDDDGSTIVASPITVTRSTGAVSLSTALVVASGGTGGTSASAARTNLGLAIGTNVQAYSAALASVAGLTTSADKMIYTTASDTYAVTALSSFGRTLVDDADASTARSTLGLAIGTNVQAYSAALASVAGLTTSADKMIYTTASDTYAVTALSSFGRTLIDDADASTARTTLGLAIGTNIQAYSAALASVAGLTTSADKMIYTTASDTYAVTALTAFGRSLVDDADASTARTTLGLGTIATLSSTNPSLTGAVIITNTLVTNLGNGDGSGQQHYTLQTGGEQRFAIGLQGAESTGNAGSNLKIFAYGDDEAFLTAPLTIVRSSGVVSVSSFGVGTATPAGPAEFYKSGTGVTGEVYVSSGLDGDASSGNKSRIVFRIKAGGGGTITNHLESMYDGTAYVTRITDGTNNILSAGTNYLKFMSSYYIPATITNGEMIMRGSVKMIDGTINNGTGFTVTFNSSGNVSITFSTAFSATPSIVVAGTTPDLGKVDMTMTSVQNTGFTMYSYYGGSTLIGGTGGGGQTISGNFIAIGYY